MPPSVRSGGPDADPGAVAIHGNPLTSGMAPVGCLDQIRTRALRQGVIRLESGNVLTDVQSAVWQGWIGLATVSYREGRDTKTRGAVD